MNIFTTFPVAQQGWQCPVCGYIYAPTWYYCTNCNRPHHEKYTTTTEIKIGSTDETKRTSDGTTET